MGGAGIFGDGAGPSGQMSKDQIDSKLAELFAKGTLPDDIRGAGLSKINYKDTGITVSHKTTKRRHGHNKADGRKRHHPIYDAQAKIGEAPMFEGARRENMLYLYNLASQLSHTVSGQNA